MNTYPAAEPASLLRENVGRGEVERPVLDVGAFEILAPRP